MEAQSRPTTESPTTLHVLYYALKDLNNVEIGQQIGITEATVRYHKKKLNWKSEETELYKANRLKLQQLIQSRISGEQIGFLTGDNCKIDDWKDFKAATISKACEVDKEVVTINQFGTVNVQINAVDDKIAALKAKLASRSIDPDEVNTVIDVDIVDNKCKE